VSRFAPHIPSCHRPDQSVHQQAKLSIVFFIIGGGISGLACAIALRRVGHRVVVLEQDGDNEEVSSEFIPIFFLSLIPLQ
jgi:heterodisulfide reductase subunit A-like polyferredoxin